RGELMPIANTKFEANGFSAAQVAQLSQEVKQFGRSAEGAVRGRRDHVFALFDQANLRDFVIHLAGRQDSAFARLRALRQFNLDQFHIRQSGALLKRALAEGSVDVSTTEVTGADLPTDVATKQVVRTNPALSGVVKEIALLRAEIQCANRGARK